jgi:hypothetical protein
MSESDAEGPREDAPNPTQEAIDEQGASDQPADVGGWTDSEEAETGGWEETEASPHAGEAGQSDDVA